MVIGHSFTHEMQGVVGRCRSVSTDHVYNQSVGDDRTYSCPVPYLLSEHCTQSRRGTDQCNWDLCSKESWVMQSLNDRSIYWSIDHGMAWHIDWLLRSPTKDLLSPWVQKWPWCETSLWKLAYEWNKGLGFSVRVYKINVWESETAEIQQNLRRVGVSHVFISPLQKGPPAPEPYTKWTSSRRVGWGLLTSEDLSLIELTRSKSFEAFA